MGKLKEKIEAANRSKAKFEEELRNLNKEREEFEKEKEERNKEFEERMKNESAKLLKEKKIMKEAQLAGKGDYRLKNEINELKKALEDSKE